MGIIARRLALVVLALAVVWLSPLAEARQDIPDHLLVQSGDAYVRVNDRSQTWKIGTASTSRQTDFDTGGGYHLISLLNKLTGREWLAPRDGPTSELQLGLDGQVVNSSARDFQVRTYNAWRGDDGCVQLEIESARDSVALHLHYAAFPGTSIIEQWSEIENGSKTAQCDISDIDSISYTLCPTQEALTSMP